MLSSHFTVPQTQTAPQPVPVVANVPAPTPRVAPPPANLAPPPPQMVLLAPYVVETDPAPVTSPVSSQAPGTSEPLQLESGHPAQWIARPAPPQNVAAPVPQSNAQVLPPVGELGGFDYVHPPVNIDWSVGLKGSYAMGTMKTQHSIVLTPEVTLDYGGDRMDISGNASLEGVVSDQQLARVDQLSSGLDVAYALDPVTSASLSAAFDVSQEDANAPGVPSNIKVMPIVFEGSLSAGIDRQFGQLGLGLSGDLGRTDVTKTYLQGGKVENNADQSFFSGGANLRASFQVTPILAPFVEAGIGRDVYDKAPKSTGMKLDQTNYSLRAGLVAQWQDSLSIEASTGYTWAFFDDPGLTDIGTQTFALSVDYAPPQGVTAGLGFSTTINPGDPDNSVVASVDYGIDGNVGVQLNNQIGLEADFSAGWTAPVSGLPGDFTYSAGLGATYQFNRYTALTADYAYTAVDRPTGPLLYSHTISAGISVSRPE